MPSLRRSLTTISATLWKCLARSIPQLTVRRANTASPNLRRSRRGLRARSRFCTASSQGKGSHLPAEVTRQGGYIVPVNILIGDATDRRLPVLIKHLLTLGQTVSNPGGRLLGGAPPIHHTAPRNGAFVCVGARVCACQSLLAGIVER